MKYKCEICGKNGSYLKISDKCKLVFCRECYHFMIIPGLCNELVREHAWGGKETFDRVRLLFTYHRLKRYIKNRKNLRILEIGFGKGFLLMKFLKQGHSVYGIEAGKLELDIPEELKKKAKLFFGNAEDVELSENYYDLILGIHLIEHLDYPLEVFKKCYKALKKGGMVYFITPNGSSMSFRFFRGKWWFLEDPTHRRFFSPLSLKLALLKSGFKKIKIDYPFFDSLTLEINSLKRFFVRDSKKYGVMEKGLFYPLLMTMPYFLIFRTLSRKFRPSLEIVAWK